MRILLFSVLVAAFPVILASQVTLKESRSHTYISSEDVSPEPVNWSGLSLDLPAPASGAGFDVIPNDREFTLRPAPAILQPLAWDRGGRPTWIARHSHAPLTGSREEMGWQVLEECAELLRIPMSPDSWELLHSTETSDRRFHLTWQQRHRGIPILYGELKMHGRGGHIDLLNGQTFPPPKALRLQPDLTASQAQALIKQEIGQTDISAVPGHYLPALADPRLVIVYLDGQPFLAWEVHHLADVLHHWSALVDAGTGAILKKRLETCTLHHHSPLDGPVVSTAPDLYGINRTVHAYQVGATHYLMDGSRPMFNAGLSQLPDEPVGGILTVDAGNTSPANSNFAVSHVTSATNNWNNPTAVSAHYNAGVAYEYYRNTFSRNSINGQGGSIISLIHVAETNGQSMDNAFWNGAAMFYGDGDQAFFPLARALDVAGHEMTHGVIQATANLVYENESGALNESFADIFAAMIDREDWAIGEDVVNPAFFPSGALRDMADPHNGGNGLGDPGWQPKHTNEQYTGPQDNGGVHINSGIPNHAFYLFASDPQVSKEMAEQVFYRALDSYLVKSSQFLDLRFAVIQACKDLYGPNTPLVGIAESAFNAVGIGSGSSGGGTPNDYQDDLVINPGDDFLLFTDDLSSQLYISLPDGGQIEILSTTSPLSRPSVTDDGTAIVFVGTDRRIHLVTIDWQTGNTNQSIIQNQPIWQNVAVARDGSRLAAVTEEIAPEILVFDFGLQAWETFALYNPTFSEGVTTGEVQFPDAIEFDHTGRYVLYDAFNEVTNTSGQDLDYWDIGILEVWSSSGTSFADGEIFKLFSSLPENSSIGNPTFAKNSPYIIAFDFIDGFTNSYFVLATNLETGDVGQIYANTVVGYPNFSVDDSQMIFDSEAGFFLDPVLARIDIQSDKINGDPNSAVVLVDGGRRGVWFANGQRPLTDLDQPQFQRSVNLYPNPGLASFRVDGITGEGRILVTDLWGRIQYQGVVQAGQEVSTAHWPTGFYQVQLSNAGVILTLPWLKLD